MNFLAHTFLSCKDADLLAGNFMADFINNKEKKQLSTAMLLGVDLHKRIDSFTDSHQAVKSAIQMMRTSQGKYAPVTVDILFDYILSQEWETYSSLSLGGFTKQTYQTLETKVNEFPLQLQQRLPRMITGDFLMSCSTEEKLHSTFLHVKKRAKFDNNFENATKDMFSKYDNLCECFHTFFPDLMTNVGEFCDCN
ncbi:MAG: DUF479 domain-containing protein [Saprospiraceae bacterium]|nr:DUF479 domain-containing protein [Saprospiraceae bacterium]